MTIGEGFAYFRWVVDVYGRDPHMIEGRLCQMCFYRWQTGQR